MCYIKYLKVIIPLLLFSCSNDIDPKYNSQNNDPSSSSSENIVSILFVGNSLTIANEGINYHVQQFYNLGNSEIEAETISVSSDGFSLRDHLMSNNTLGAISQKNWDYIIIQENGIVASITPQETIDAILELKEHISATTKVFLFMTWAYEGSPEMTQQLYDVYYESAALTNYKVIPVGLGWRDFENENNAINLLSLDGSHPSNFGTYYASAMIFSIISDQSIAQIPYNYNLTISEANMIKQKVIEAINLYY